MNEEEIMEVVEYLNKIGLRTVILQSEKTTIGELKGL